MHTGTANRRAPDFCVCCAEQYFICRIFPNKNEKTEEKFSHPHSNFTHSHTCSPPQELYGRCREEKQPFALLMPYTTRVQLYTMSFTTRDRRHHPNALVQFSILFALSLLPPNSGVDDACLCCCYCWFNDKRMILMLLEDTNNKDMRREEENARLGKYAEQDAAARKREQTPRGVRFRREWV